MMRRRAFVVVVAGSPFLAPGAFAQQAAPRTYRVGVLGFNPPTQWPPWIAFVDELRQRGYAEGRNLVFEGRYAAGSVERLDALAAELVALDVDVIVTGDVVGALAARRATATIPIVMAGAADPVLRGLAASLSHPGGNVTGLSTYGPELVVKRFQVLVEACGRPSRVAYVFLHSNWTLPAFAAGRSDLDAAARSLGVEFRPVEVAEPAELASAFASFARQHIDAVLVDSHPVFNANAARIAALALDHRLPAIAHTRPFVAAGLLLAYGVNFNDVLRRAAGYVDKILNGAKPTDLPIEQATKFELFVNLKTARLLGLTLPRSLILRADEVIE